MYIVELGKLWDDPWPEYFDNFHRYCANIAQKENTTPGAVMNRELAPDGKIEKHDINWHLIWPEEKYHTMFMLRWG